MPGTRDFSHVELVQLCGRDERIGLAHDELHRPVEGEHESRGILAVADHLDRADQALSIAKKQRLVGVRRVDE